MDNQYVALISGFVGALLGAATSIASVWIQQKSQEPRDRARNSIDTAIKAHESAEKHAQFMVQNDKTGQLKIKTYDLPYYLVLHGNIAELLAEGKAIPIERWTKAYRNADGIYQAIAALTKSETESQPGPRD